MLYFVCLPSNEKRRAFSRVPDKKNWDPYFGSHGGFMHASRT